MRNLKRVFALVAVAFMIALLAGLGGVSASSSAPLTVTNAKGESLTVGSVTVSDVGSNLSIVFSTDSDFKLNFTTVTFRGNPGGITRVMSDGRTEHLTSKSSNNHSYSVPLSEIKNDDVTIFASADVIVNGKVTHSRKAFISAEFKVPTTSTTVAPTTSTTVVPTTSTTVAPTTSTTVAGTTSTTAPPTTSTTVAPTTSTTVFASTTSTSVPLVTTTVIPRKKLPVTGMEYNWYLVGAMLVLLGSGLYVGSARRSKQKV